MEQYGCNIGKESWRRKWKKGSSGQKLRKRKEREKIKERIDIDGKIKSKWTEKRMKAEESNKEEWWKSLEKKGKKMKGNVLWWKGKKTKN